MKKLLEGILIVTMLAVVGSLGFMVGAYSTNFFNPEESYYLDSYLFVEHNLCQGNVGTFVDADQIVIKTTNTIVTVTINEVIVGDNIYGFLPNDEEQVRILLQDVEDSSSTPKRFVYITKCGDKLFVKHVGQSWLVFVEFIKNLPQTIVDWGNQPMGFEPTVPPPQLPAPNGDNA